MEKVTQAMHSFRAIHTEGLEDEVIRSKEYLYQKTEFNENGQVLTEETFTSEGATEHKSMYTYDSKGNMIEEMLLEEDGFVSEHRTMEYDEKGRLWKERRHFMDESFEETVYAYSEEGLLLSKITTDSDGEAGNSTLFEYQAGLLTLEKEQDQDGEVVTEKRYQYNDKGNPESEETSGQEGNWELTHEYDANGYVCITRRYNENGELVEKSSYTRDDAGKPLTVKDESVSGIEIITLTYDDRGNLLVQETKDANEELISLIERTYNDQNQVETTYVHVVQKWQRPAQDYRLRFEYTYFDSAASA